MADNDDILDQDEIEKLLESTGSSDPPGTADGPSPPAAKPEGQPDSEPAADGALDQDEIEALLQQSGSAQSDANPAEGSAGEVQPPEQLLNQAEADLAAALSPNLEGRGGMPKELGEPTAFEFQPFEELAGAPASNTGLKGLEDVELDLRIELGRAELLVEEVLELREGSVVPLDKLAGDPVDIVVNGRLIARGEVLVLNDNFCVRVAEILSPDP